MPSVTHVGFKIKSIADGTFYKARADRSDGAQFHANGKITTSWESSLIHGRRSRHGTGDLCDHHRQDKNSQTAGKGSHRTNELSGVRLRTETRELP